MVDRWWQKLAQKLWVRTGSSPFAKSSRQTQGSFSNVEMVFDLTREPKQNLGLPADAIPGLSVLKELIRGLRYRTIDSLVGLELELTSIQKASDEICSLIRMHGIEPVGGVRDLSAGAFLKYGLLDCEYFDVVTDFIPEPQRAKFLKDMGFLPDKADVNDELFPDAGIGFLEEMVDEIRQGKLLFKIMLDSSGAYRGAQGGALDKCMSIDPNRYFPCKFVVRDACITNCSLIWLIKHFYL